MSDQEVVKTLLAEESPVGTVGPPVEVASYLPACSIAGVRLRGIEVSWINTVRLEYRDFSI
jgi:hypothetical protein